MSKRADAYLSAFAKHNRFSGVVLVAREGKILFRHAYGFADQAKHIPNTPETRFRIFSMTKTFTATAILLLQQDKKLLISDPVSNYFPTWPVEWKRVLIGHLLAHDSGIDVMEGFAWWAAQQKRPITIPGYTLKLRDHPDLLFEPDDHFAYSNSGFVILGELVKTVSKQSYRDFLQEKIFRPLKMDNTDAWRPDIIEKRAKGYSFPGSVTIPREQPVDFLIGAGDIVSTVDDLLKFDTAIYTGTLLSEPIRRVMFMNRGEGVCYGWFSHDDEEPSYFEHTGQGNGFQSAIRHYPDDQLCVIVLSNTSWITDERLNPAGDLAKIAYGQAVAPPTFVELTRKQIRQYSGTYASVKKRYEKSESLKISPGKDSTELLFSDLKLPAFAIVAETRTSFSCGPLRLTFESGKQSRTFLKLTYPDGHTQRFQKVR